MAGGASRLNRYRVDLHVHIGRNSLGQPVKITGAKDLVFSNIAAEAGRRIGLHLVGIVDCASPRVLGDIDELLDSGDMKPAPGGGIIYGACGATVILGAEIEAGLPGGPGAHYLCFMRDIDSMKQFSRKLEPFITNIGLSTQRARLEPLYLAELTTDLGGLFIPAHVFTPFKSVYGTCARRMKEVFGSGAPSLISGIELGLSADTAMADSIGELGGYTFVSNSDAHSLPKIGREFNIMAIESPSFDELRMALARRDGRRVVANYGLDPRLGKYHVSACEVCNGRFHIDQTEDVRCPVCGSARVVVGVSDRLAKIADEPRPDTPLHRPPYRYQVPLEFVPGIGPAKIQALVQALGSELTALHDATLQQLSSVVGEPLAALILKARTGQLAIEAGGGGTYGKARAD